MSALIGGGDRDVDAGLGLEVEGDAALQLELVVHHLEAVVGDLEALAVAGIRVDHGQVANDGAGRVLSDRLAAERHRGLRLVHISDADGELLRDVMSALIGGGDRDVDAGLDLEVERDAALQLELIVHHLEAAVGDLEALAVAGIRIDHGQVADSGAGRVLCDGLAAERQAGLRLIHIGDADGELLRDIVAALVRGGDGHVDAGLDLEVEGDAILQLELVVHHLEAVVGDLEALAVAGIRVDYGQIADDRTGRVLCHLAAGERQAGLRLVLIDHVDMQSLRLLVASRRCDGHREVDGRFDLIVEAQSFLQAEHTIDHFETGIRYLESQAHDIPIDKLPDGTRLVFRDLPLIMPTPGDRGGGRQRNRDFTVVVLPLGRIVDDAVLQ